LKSYLYFEEYAYHSYILSPEEPQGCICQKYIHAIWSTMQSRHKNRQHHVLIGNVQDLKAFWKCY